MQALKQLTGNEKLVQILTAYGIDHDHIDVILRKGVTYQSFLNHPYSITRVTEIDFYTIDAIALQVFHLTPYSFMRLCAYVQNVMDQYIKNGDTCVLAENLQCTINRRLQLSPAPDTNMTAVLLAACAQQLQFVQQSFDKKLYFYDKKIAQEEEA